MTQSIGMRRIQLDKEIARMQGAALPDDNKVDPHVNALLDECQQLLQTEQNLMRVVTTPSSLADAKFDSTNNVYYIEINPNFQGDKPGVNRAVWITAALLHEIMHVRCGRMYSQPHDKGATGMFNLHVPALTGDKTKDRQAIGGSLEAQCAVVMENLDTLDAVVKADDTLSSSQRAHLSGRIAYARTPEEAHYDTVLLDMLVVITMAGWPTKSKTFDLIRRMSEEAQDRRQGRPAPLTTVF